MAVELRALFLLSLCFPGLQGQTLEVRRREGCTLYFQCPYAAKVTAGYTKYWCRLRNGRCEEVLRANNDQSKKSDDGRITVKDDNTRRTVFVTMTDLKAEDSDVYFCTDSYSSYVPWPRKISLSVFKELLQWELDTLSVQCPKWCNQWNSGCTVLPERQTSATPGEIKPLKDRASIKYNSQGILTFTMEKLQSRDSGVYSCALVSEHNLRMEVVLSVLKRTQQHTAQVSGSISVQCQYKIDFKAVSKAWCKMEKGETCNVLVTTSPEPSAGNSTAQGGVRIQDDPQEGIVTITMEQLQLQDSGVYWCALQEPSGLSRMEEIMLKVSKVLPRRGFPDTESKSREILLGDSPEASCNENTFTILSVVLLVLLLLALVTCTALGVRLYRLLGRAGNREAEDASDRPEGTAQPGSTGKRESSQDDSKGPAYINMDVQSQPSPEDPLYCNVELSQAHRNPQHVEYAIIAFKQSPRSSRE